MIRVSAIRRCRQGDTRQDIIHKLHVFFFTLLINLRKGGARGVGLLTSSRHKTEGKRWRREEKGPNKTDTKSRKEKCSMYLRRSTFNRRLRPPQPYTPHFHDPTPLGSCSTVDSDLVSTQILGP